MQRVISRAKLTGADYVIQLGDFGIWPKMQPNKDTGRHDMVLDPFAEKVSDLAVKHEIPVYFIAGNHEWHPWLQEQEDKFGWKDPIEIFPNLFYLPNGCTFDIGGRTFGVLGGAHSVDWRYRVPGRSWWETEMPTPEEVGRLGTMPLDVLLTHDSPEQLSIYQGFRLPIGDEDKNEVVRQLIRKAIRHTKPKVLLHGHHHVSYTNAYFWFDSSDDELKERTTQVFGLAHDGDPENACAEMQTSNLLTAHTNICRD